METVKINIRIYLNIIRIYIMQECSNKHMYGFSVNIYIKTNTSQRILFGKQNSEFHLFNIF